MVLEAQPDADAKQSFATRRTRKQLLHRLSKQPVAAQYKWEALAMGNESLSEEEGWARVLHTNIPALYGIL